MFRTVKDAWSTLPDRTVKPWLSFPQAGLWLPTFCSFSGNRMRHARIPLRPLLAAASRLPQTW